VHCFGTKAPSLHRHYPASSVLRASPSSQAALPCPHGQQVATPKSASTARDFPCCYRTPSRACCHQCPGGMTRCFFRSLDVSWQPSPCFSWVDFRIRWFRDLSGVHHITACPLADSLLRSLLHQGLRTLHCFHARLGCYRLERTLPGGLSKLSHWSSAPLSRRTQTGSKAVATIKYRASNRQWLSRNGSEQERLGHSRAASLSYTQVLKPATLLCRSRGD
jgi:hypothetical protein